MQENSKAAAILHGKCPKCRKGDMFAYPIHKVSKIFEMNKICSECGLRFEVEPGFYFGAMYISYAFSVALFAIIGVALSVIGDFPIYVYLIAIAISVILFFPAMFRFSRILFLHLFGGIRYQGSDR